ncbi:hypothetical protein FQA39_LY11818 [Lamprigera yunnana]|nr:hypothetical protein FQA39_LY11818 [Lamprigera yunnana]
MVVREYSSLALQEYTPNNEEANLLGSEMSDNSLLDPDFVNSSEISSSESKENDVVEGEIEEQADKQNSRFKRKLPQTGRVRDQNKRSRMHGEEYLGLKKDDDGHFKTGIILAHSNESLESLTKCVIQKGTNCMNNNYTSTISYFCGQDEKCGLPNSQWALQQAQANVNKYYSVVGVLEELNTTLLVLEVQLPYFFKKSSQLYFNHLLKKHKKKKQRIIHQALRDYLRKKLDKEYEFYNWIKDRLSIQINMTKIKKQEQYITIN